MDNDIATLNGEHVQAARSKLVDRISTLERRVNSTIADATASVRESSAAVRNGVRAVCDTATNNIQEALDVRKRIREHPWTGIGWSALAGFVAGFLPRRVPRASYTATQPAGPGVFHSLAESLKRELITVGETAIASASGALREQVAAAMDRTYGRPAQNNQL